MECGCGCWHGGALGLLGLIASARARRRQDYVEVGLDAPKSPPLTPWYAATALLLETAEEVGLCVPLPCPADFVSEAKMLFKIPAMSGVELLPELELNPGRELDAAARPA